VVRVKALGKELLVVQLAKREARNLIEYRYNVRSIEKTVYVFVWTKRRKRERERAGKLSGFYPMVVPQASNNIPVIMFTLDSTFSRCRNN
jgi:hypothetical protein